MRARRLLLAFAITLFAGLLAPMARPAHALTRDVYPYDVAGTNDSVTVPIKLALTESARSSAYPNPTFDIETPIGVDLGFYVTGERQGTVTGPKPDNYYPTVRDASALVDDGDPTLANVTFTEPGNFTYSYVMTTQTLSNLRMQNILYSVQNYTQPKVAYVHVSVSRGDDGRLTATATSDTKLALVRSVKPAAIFFAASKTIVGNPPEPPTFTFVSVPGEGTPELGAGEGPVVNSLAPDDGVAVASDGPDVDIPVPDGPDVDIPGPDGPGPGPQPNPNPMPANGQTQVIGDGVNIFQPTCLTTPGTYTYTFTEKNDAPAGWHYDTTEHVVTVTTRYDGTDTLAYECTFDGKPFSPTTNESPWYGLQYYAPNIYLIPFVNTYTPTPANIALGVSKRVDGDAPATDGSFSFRLSGDCDEQTVAVTGAGTADFAPISFAQPGTYRLQVAEVAGNEPGYAYDRTVHEVVVRVTDNGGTLAATMTVDGKPADSGTRVEFTNTYTTPPATETPDKPVPTPAEKNPSPSAHTTPATGDAAGQAALAATAAAALAATAAAALALVAAWGARRRAR